MHVSTAFHDEPTVGRKAKQASLPEDNGEEQEMLEAAIEVVAEMQLTADELKVCN